jgi:hypothetical protein
MACRVVSQTLHVEARHHSGIRDDQQVSVAGSENIRRLIGLRRGPCDGRAGRVRPALAVGELDIEFLADDLLAGRPRCDGSPLIHERLAELDVLGACAGRHRHPGCGHRIANRGSRRAEISGAYDHPMATFGIPAKHLESRSSVIAEEPATVGCRGARRGDGVANDLHAFGRLRCHHARDHECRDVDRHVITSVVAPAGRALRLKNGIQVRPDNRLLRSNFLRAIVGACVNGLKRQEAEPSLRERRATRRAA